MRVAAHDFAPDYSLDPFAPAFEQPCARKGSFMRGAAWMASAGLVAAGAIGLHTDYEFAAFDGCCVLAGIAAAPPVTDYLRRLARGKFRGWTHAMVVVGVLGAAIAFDLGRSAIMPAAFPVNSHARLVSFSVITPAVDPTQAVDTEAQNKAYLADVAAQLSAMNGERAAASVDDEPSAADINVLAARQALVSRRRDYTLSPQDTTLVNRFAQQVAAARRDALPGLRRAFIEQLNGPLESYGVSARMAGDDVLEFDGPALTDAQKQTLTASLTRSQRALLGIKDVMFADSGAIRPASADAQTTLSSASEPQPGA